MSREWLNKENKQYILIRDILNKYDLEGCYKDSGDIDEYSPEITDILNKFSFAISVKEVKNIVKGVFDVWFCDDIECSDEMAVDIFRVFKYEN